VLKLGLALSGAVIGWTLAGCGYLSGGETQSPQTLRWIIALFTLFPAACYALSALAAGKYRLRRAEMATIAATLHP
jgi:GPH family glycoside/pentoside/hexuronide:cation symporter